MPGVVPVLRLEKRSGGQSLVGFNAEVADERGAGDYEESGGGSGTYSVANFSVPTEHRVFCQNSTL